MVFSERETIFFEHLNKLLLSHAIRFPLCPGAPNDNFRKNVCSEDDLISRIFETFVVKFLACLPASPRIFEHLKMGVIGHF